MHGTLIVTNGDAACAHIRAAGIDAELLPWRDVLHDGPLPAGLTHEGLSDARAAFLASWSWGRKDDIRALLAARDRTLADAARRAEVVLWFEHDLYDQLQLLQVLDLFAGLPRRDTRLTLRCRDRFLTSIPVARLGDELAARRPVDDDLLNLAAAAWTAVRAPTPEPMAALASQDHAPLPYLRAALRRFLEELPDAHNGLSRSERQVLEVVAAGASAPADLFDETQRREDPRYLGDASFFQYLARLAAGARPALRTVDGLPFDPIAAAGRDLPPQPLSLTHDGRALLDERLDWVEANGIDRWLGGTRLNGRQTWRWDRGRLRWK